ncbi:HDOD domain-containing protein [Thermodesulfatator atlanticus]|uniref:HDOD domain-containing protein n=1 Tax=Thermodesulfatator atlanticus TaxID=501497 RepID=UPI0003B4E42D|nr:HDOD domain-containing protein [Thermodesulfatator atlanticus]
MKAEIVRLVNKFKRTANLPVFEETAKALSQLRAEREKTVERIVRIVLFDPGLCCQVLRAGNSVFYNPMGLPMRTISRAVAILGFENLRSLARTSPFFSAEDFNNKYLAQELAISILSAHFAGKAALKKGLDGEEAYLGALLKRLGRLVMLRYAPEHYLKIRELAPRKRKEIFHLVGEKLAKQWNLPANVIANLEGRELYIRPKRREYLCLYADLAAAGMVAGHGPRGWQHLFSTPEEINACIQNLAKSARHLPQAVLNELPFDIAPEKISEETDLGPFLPEEALRLCEKFLESLGKELKAQGSLFYREGDKIFALGNEEKEIKGPFQIVLNEDKILAKDGKIYVPLCFRKVPAVLLVFFREKPLNPDELTGLKFIKKTIENLLEKL